MTNKFVYVGGFFYQMLIGKKFNQVKVDCWLINLWISLGIEAGEPLHAYIQ